MPRASIWHSGDPEIFFRQAPPQAPTRVRGAKVRVWLTPDVAHSNGRPGAVKREVRNPRLSEVPRAGGHVAASDVARGTAALAAHSAHGRGPNGSLGPTYVRHAGRDLSRHTGAITPAVAWSGCSSQCAGAGYGWTCSASTPPQCGHDFGRFPALLAGGGSVGARPALAGLGRAPAGSTGPLES